MPRPSVVLFVVLVLRVVRRSLACGVSRFLGARIMLRVAYFRYEAGMILAIMGLAGFQLFWLSFAAHTSLCFLLVFLVKPPAADPATFEVVDGNFVGPPLWEERRPKPNTNTPCMDKTRWGNDSARGWVFSPAFPIRSLAANEFVLAEILKDPYRSSNEAAH